MQSLLVLTLVTVAVVNIGTDHARAGEQPLNQCLTPGPEIGATNLLEPYATTVHEVTRQVLSGNVGYGLGYVDNPHVHGNSALDPNPKQILVYPTTHGLYIVRIFDLPAGVGLHGPF